MVTRGNALENCRLCTHFTEIYWATFNNTSGNVLKIATEKMVQNFHKSMVTCMVTHMVTRGNAWQRVLRKHKRYQKAKLMTMNESKCLLLHSDCVEH